MAQVQLSEQKILDIARRFRAALNQVDASLWAHVAVTDFPKAACGHASEMLGKHLRELLGVDPDYVVKDNYEPGGSWRGGHAWLEIDDLVIDITGDQFGWEPVIVSRSSKRHAEGELNRRGPLTNDEQWWGRYGAPIYAVATTMIPFVEIGDQ